MKIFIVTCLMALCGIMGCNAQNKPTADTSSHEVTHRNITDSARVAIRQRDSNKALEYHKLALQHARKSSLHKHEARSLMHIALLLKGQDAKQSLQYLKSALEIADRLNQQDLRADILLATSSVYKQQQNYEESLAALEAHQKLLMSVFERNKVQETKSLHAEEDRERERDIWITIFVSLVLLVITFAFYYRRTSRLNRALSKSNQIKDTLFSIIGHDLRGPAGSIMQALEMIDTGLMDSREEKQVIGMLKRQSRSFNETLNTLLNWASAQLKGAQPHLTPVDTMTTIQKSLDLLNAQAVAKDIKINYPLEKKLSVLADSDQFDFVVRNLISNAIKFSYPGGHIDISAEQQADSALIAVHDDGQGIPAEKQSELFAEGRLNSTFGTNGEKGTGLGLMLSWDFIRANNGKIWCDSKEGAGTTFYISLPLAL